MKPEKAIEILENYHNGYFGYKIEEVHEAHRIAIEAIRNGTFLPKGHGRLIDADALKEEISGEWFVEPNATIFNCVFNIIDNAPTVEPCYQTTSCLDCKMYDKEKHNCPRFCEVIREIAKENQRPQGEYSIEELRRWLISQGFSEGTADDKIESFQKLIKRIREEE